MERDGPYDADFLGSVSVPLPTLLPGTAQHAWNNGAVVDHTNYSLVFNQARELAVYTAANIDEHLVPGISRRRFTFDPDVPRQIQIDDNRGYKGFPTKDDNPWDAGRLARRKGVHWPDEGTAKAAERDNAHNFCYVKLTPWATRGLMPRVYSDAAGSDHGMLDRRRGVLLIRQLGRKAACR